MILETLGVSLVLPWDIMGVLKGKLGQQPNSGTPFLTDNYFLMSGTSKWNFSPIHPKSMSLGGKEQGE